MRPLERSIFDNAAEASKVRIENPICFAVCSITSAAREAGGSRIVPDCHAARKDRSGHPISRPNQTKRASARAIRTNGIIVERKDRDRDGDGVDDRAESAGKGAGIGAGTADLCRCRPGDQQGGGRKLLMGHAQPPCRGKVPTGRCYADILPSMAGILRNR
jgi:hypothetical protein